MHNSAPHNGDVFCSGDLALSILALGIVWTQVFSFTLWPL